MHFKRLVCIKQILSTGAFVVLLVGTPSLLLTTTVHAADNRTFPSVSTSVSVRGKEDKKRQKEYLAWKKLTDNKIKKLERAVSNRTILDLLRQIEQLSLDVSHLRGALEEQNNRINRLKKKQKKIYISQDQRLTELEKRPVPTAAPSLAVTPSSVENTAINFKNAPINQEKTLSTAAEKKSYKSAFSLIMQAKYEDAITEFEDFLEQHPNSAYSDNALYWLGEANYATQRYATALKKFTALMQRYPRSNKVPDALLKISFCYYELKQWALTKSNLLHLINTYPKHKTTPLAKKRLQLLNAEGH